MKSQPSRPAERPVDAPLTTRLPRPRPRSRPHPRPPWPPRAALSSVDAIAAVARVTRLVVALLPSPSFVLVQIVTIGIELSPWPRSASARAPSELLARFPLTPPPPSPSTTMRALPCAGMLLAAPCSGGFATPPCCCAPACSPSSASSPQPSTSAGASPSIAFCSLVPCTALRPTVAATWPRPCAAIPSCLVAPCKRRAPCPVLALELTDSLPPCPLQAPCVA